MLKHFAALGAALVISAAAAQAAPSQVRACTLLTANEISTALGTQPGASKENNFTIPEGPSKGDTMASCMWPLAGMDVVTLSAVRALQGAQRDAALADLDNEANDMKAHGWTEERQSIAGARCSIMAPPAAEKDAPVMTGCFVEAKGMALSVGAMNKTKKLAMQPVKDLLDKAVARLP